MTPFDSIASVLNDALQLTLPPVGIAFTDDAPEGIARYQGTAPGGCRFWQEAMTQVFATVPRDHNLCAIGLYTHHLDGDARTQADLQDALKVFGDLGYVRPEDMPFIPVLKRKAKVVVYGPLNSLPLPPDVVLLFVKSEQMLILAEASQQMDNGLPPAMGRPACAVIPQALNTGRTALSLGCCGARSYLDALTPDLALYAIPGLKLKAFTERVEVLAKANAVLKTFHTMRRAEVEAGRHPSVRESLNALQ